MIRNYLLIALRSLWRNKLITAINLVGMAIGFGIFLTLLSWVRFDSSFDKFHEDIDRMYLLNVRFTMNDSEYTSQRTGGLFASVLDNLFPQIESSCRASQPFEFELGVKELNEDPDAPMKHIDEDLVLAVDTNFLSFYTFPLISGTIDEVFTTRDHIVLTRTLSEKLFGETDAMGRQVKIGEGGYFTVAGVVEDPPVESSLQFGALLGFHILEEMGYPVNEYGGTMYFNNFKVVPGTDMEALNRAIQNHVEENFEAGFESIYFLDDFVRLHLYGESKGIIGYMMQLIMSIMILLIASINFINLTTAYSSQRLKEIAIRKSAGAGKRQLIIQFMGESYLLLLIAFYLGFFIAEHLVPLSYRAFNISQEITHSGSGFWIQVVAIYLVTGFLAGLYPAMKIAGYTPLTYFSDQRKGNYRGRSRSRRVLIVLQFVFSIFFITVSVFIVRQFNYLKEADLGFNREDVIYIRTKGRAWDTYQLIKAELEKLAFVEGVSSGSEIPVNVAHGDIDWGERDGEHNKLARMLWTSPDFLSTFEIELQEGEFYTEERDSLNYSYAVVNRSLTDLMGWDDPVGQQLYLWGEERTILGVTENINFVPFKLEVFGDEALIYLYDPVRDYIFVRVIPGTGPEQIAAIEGIFQKHNPGYQFEHDFVSNYNYELLESADGIKLMFRIFSAIAIFIAVMGLIGLSQFNNSRRTKEMGIHKVMGAQTASVARLLLSEFMKLVLLSNLVALPLAYLAMGQILRFFSYTIDLKITVFLTVLLLSLLLSLVTVSYHALRSARSNPVDSLRYE